MSRLVTRSYAVQVLKEQGNKSFLKLAVVGGVSFALQAILELGYAPHPILKPSHCLVFTLALGEYFRFEKAVSVHCVMPRTEDMSIRPLSEFFRPRLAGLLCLGAISCRVFTRAVCVHSKSTEAGVFGGLMDIATGLALCGLVFLGHKGHSKLSESVAEPTKCDYPARHLAGLGR